eukprot:scaffold26656_cov149-Skeletonema_menzelii.AAC.9
MQLQATARTLTTCLCLLFFATSFKAVPMEEALAKHPWFWNGSSEAFCPMFVSVISHQCKLQTPAKQSAYQYKSFPAARKELTESDLFSRSIEGIKTASRRRRPNGKR